MTVRKWGTEQIVKTGVAASLIAENKVSDVAALADGGYVVVWKNDNAAPDDIHGQRFDAAAARVGSEFTVGASLNAFNKFDVVATGLAGGGFVVGFTYDVNTGDSYFERSNSAGALQGSAVEWDTGATQEGDAAITPFGSGFLLLERVGAAPNGDIWVHRRDVDGNPVQFSAVMNSLLRINADAASGHQHDASVTAIDRGNRFVVAWVDDNDTSFKMRVFNGDGGLVTFSAIVKDYLFPGSGDVEPEVVGLANGSFVVTWHEFQDPGSLDQSDYGVKARVYDRNGGVISPEIQVNTFYNGSQSRPDVTALPDGGFLIAFQDAHAGNLDISGQLYDAFGNRVGAQFAITTTTSGFDASEKLTTLTDGRVVAIWSDLSVGVIRQQILDPRDGLVTGTGNSDVLYGHDAYADEINGLFGDDVLSGLDGNDFLYGGEGADTLNGNEGDDRFYGGSGNDIYNGGLGNDWFFVDDAGDVVNELAGEGTLDRVFASVSYTLTPNAEIERFSTSDHAGTTPINLTGNAFPDNIFGNAGPNTLDGKGGADIMTGWGGDDLFFVDNAGDAVIEAAGQGTDRVLASVSYALGAGQSIEKLTTTDSAATTPINLTGNEFANLIFGNAGPNILDGKGGADTMLGFEGDDLYYVDNAGDAISEVAGGGTGDRVLASVSYTLGAGVQVEKLTTDDNAGTAPLILIGNEFGNAIFGNAGNNSLRGMAGNDTLFGLGGSDVFVFNTALNAATNVDTITDFASDDNIFLIGSIFSAIGPGTLAASAFVIGPAATTAAHRIIYNAGALLYDPDGVGGAAAVQFATLSGAPAITNADFIVV